MVIYNKIRCIQANKKLYRVTRGTKSRYTIAPNLQYLKSKFTNSGNLPKFEFKHVWIGLIFFVNPFIGKNSPFIGQRS